MARLRKPPPTPAAEIVISLAGPIVSIALGAAAIGALRITRFPDTPSALLGYILQQFALWNLFIGVFNLLPGAPLDGGGVVRGIGWAVSGRRAGGVTAAAVLGVVSAVAALTAAIAGVLPTEFDIGILGGVSIDMSTMAAWAALLLLFGSGPTLLGRRRPRRPSASDDLASTMQYAQQLAAHVGADVVTTDHLLWALAATADPLLGAGLEKNGVTSSAVRDAIVTGDVSSGPPPPFSVAVESVRQRAIELGRGRIGLFLALPPDSGAARTVARIGSDIVQMQRRLDAC